jgi:hypothetical protein
MSRAEMIRAAAVALPLTAVIFLAGGPVALAVPALVLLGGWRRSWLPAIAAGAMLLAGIAAATARTPTALGGGPFGGPAQFCALVALTAALLPAITRRPGRTGSLDGSSS